jgi:hypothetical protein
MKQMIAAACGVWLTLTAPVQAQGQSAVVVELYTSQGCSSCPPADALLAGLTNDPRVIPLALHVDYWDYLGWKDKFADPKFTARQKAYAHHARDKMVYTPQMVIGGQTRIVGSRVGELENAIRQAAAVAAAVELDLSRQGNDIMIRAKATRPLSQKMVVQLVRYKAEQEVAIKRGENAGKTITYRNIVTSWQVVGSWSGAAPLALQARADGSDSAVVIIQSEGPAEILAAARLK